MITNIKFGYKKFDCAVFLNTELPDKSVISKFAGIPFIAADGAANLMIGADIKPDYIIGDMDSLNNGIVPEGVVVIKEESQDTNDFEKIIEFALKKDYRDIIVFGFHGGELEHTFNNWSVFSKYSSQLRMTLFDNNRYAFNLRGKSLINCNAGETLSLIPQYECVLKTKNLKWELKGELLSMGKREGARNVALESEVEIELISGELLFFMDARMPFAPEFISF